jgi:crossover junction endodeoxyribonuclease RuvC
VIVVGIDPGLTGGVALLEGDLARVWDMPTKAVKVGGEVRERIDPKQLALLLGDEAFAHLVVPEDGVAFIERANASPHMGVSSAFSYGEGFGIVRGILAHLNVTTQLVTSVKWKREMGLVKPGSRELGRNDARDKQPSLELARKLYPQLADQLRLKKHEGRAEALLIAHYGAEQLEGALFAQHARPAPLPEVEF